MLQPEDVIDGKYRIVRRIGKGGMGAVYEGENIRIHRRVAIKVLHATVAEDKSFVQRFEREAQAAGRIGSDHIVEVLDLGDLPGGDRFMVMEYLEGESLRERMKRLGSMTPEEIFPLIADLLDGLAEAHGAGIIHRDLKPDNVFLVSERKYQTDFVKILDFGVSKFKQLSADSVTQTGVMLGTPHYMAPEQAKGDKVIDHRADLYSVGVILFRALTGRNPFEADSFNELMFKVVLEDAPRPTSFVPTLDAEAESIVLKAMARDRDGRFRSADEFAGALREWLSNHGFELSFLRSVRASRAGLAPRGRADASTDDASSRALGSGSVAATGSVEEPSLGTRMTSASVVSAASRLPRRGPLQFAAVGILIAAGIFGAAALLLRPSARSPAAGPPAPASAAGSPRALGSQAPVASTASAATAAESPSVAPTATASGGAKARPRAPDVATARSQTPPPLPASAASRSGRPPATPSSQPPVTASSASAERKWRTDI